MVRKSPGKYDYGSGGAGSVGHLAVALLEQVARVKLNHVPFKGGGPSVLAAVAGQVWFAMYTPAAIVTRLNLEIVKSLESPELRDQVTRAGRDPQTSTPEDLGRLLRSDTARWAKVIRAAGITLN